MSYKKEYEQFYSITKPIRFRKLKLFRNYVKDWCVALRDLIKYNYYNILYKLNIIMRYSYRDDVEKVHSLPQSIEEPKVATKLVRADVKSSLIEDRDIHIDYFYKLTRDGHAKRLYTIVDRTEIKTYVVSRLENIQVKVDKWYDIHKLPILKVSYLKKYTKPSWIDENRVEFVHRTMPTYSTLTIDTRKLLNLHRKILVDINHSSFRKEHNRLLYQNCAEANGMMIEKYLNTLTLRDLRLEENPDELS